jgi:hypothetical protein
VQIRVTPKNARAKLNGLAPGADVVFGAGTYGDILGLNLGNLNDAGAPETILRSEGGATISMGVSANEFRVNGNECAKKVSERPPPDNYPGLWPYLMNGRLKLARCRNMRIKGLEFELSWPTHIAISECKEIAIKACHFRDGTFAVGAKGRKTYGITIEKCTWLQDREPGRMWKEIPWCQIHGAKGDG